MLFSSICFSVTCHYYISLGKIMEIAWYRMVLLTSLSWSCFAKTMSLCWPDKPLIRECCVRNIRKTRPLSYVRLHAWVRVFIFGSYRKLLTSYHYWMLVTWVLSHVCWGEAKCYVNRRWMLEGDYWTSAKDVHLLIIFERSSVSATWLGKLRNRTTWIHNNRTRVMLA